MMASAAPEGLTPNFLTEGIILKNLVINYSVYTGNETRAGYRVMSASLDGKNILIDIANPGVVGFIERAIDEVINRAITSDEQSISITVSLPSITLSDNLKAHITEKYEADPIINSLIFNV